MIAFNISLSAGVIRHGPYRLPVVSPGSLMHETKVIP